MREVEPVDDSGADFGRAGAWPNVVEEADTIRTYPDPDDPVTMESFASAGGKPGIRPPDVFRRSSKESESADLDSIVLARTPTTERERRIAGVMACFFGLLVIAAFPWVRQAGPVIPPVVSLFTSGIVIADLATAFLLGVQLEAEPDLSSLLVACAYLFSSLMGVAHVLTFPDAVIPGARVLGGPQLTSYVFAEWRLGFAGLMLTAALLLRRRSRGSSEMLARNRREWPWVAAAAAVGLILTSAVLESRLPPLVGARGFTALGLASSWIGVALAMAAMGVMWAKTRGRQVLHLWLILALMTFCGDLVLSTSAAGRFTLGWYLGRASGFASAWTLFLVLLVRFAVQQRYALATTRALRERTIGLQVEIARRSEAEEHLLHAQKMEAMGQLTGGIAHDFNNLLASIVGNLDLLRRRASLDARASRLVDNALLGAERGKSLTGQLLVFSRLQKIILAPVPIGALFGVLEALLPRTLGPNIEIVFDRPATDLCVLADGTQLELALLNLALNARDAMPDGGMLVIAASPDSEDGAPDLAVGPPVRLTVSDSGAGMAPDVLARAFEPFFTTKGVGKGTGLGLSQVFGLAERAGGTARIESRVGQGTSVHIILPSALPSRTEAGAGSDADRGSAWAGGGKVLVIDDDPGVREVLVGHLQDLGLAVAQASDGPSGLDMLDTTAPDLLLVDFAMPGMNGAEVVRAARARFPDLPVVFVSGYADSDAIDRAVGQNALILRKPFRAHELRAILAEALRPEGVASPASV